MTDKGSTWFNGTGVIASPPPRMQTRSVVTPSSSRPGGIARSMLIVGGLSICTALFLIAIPASFAWESLRVIGVGIVLLCVFHFHGERLKPAFVIWWLVLISECIFFREGDEYSNTYAFQGKFPLAAYGEVVGWILCFLAVLISSARVRGYFGRLFAGDYKWPMLFAMLALASCIYAPRPLLAMVWAFKLTLAVLVIWLCATQIHNLRDTVSFLSFTFWAYAIIVLQPVVVAIFQGVLFDEEGRMSTVVSPNALSPNAGVWVLLALTLYSNRKGEGLRKSAIVFGLVACVIMILAGSKTGILAGIFAGGLFYFLRGRVGSAMSYIAATAILIAALASATPLGDYFHHYTASSGADTFSGRTILWSAVMPTIRQKPILGHGYLSSEFVEFQVNAVEWAAPHLHNGFLEAVYNNGVPGLGVIVVICFIIPTNLYRVLRAASSTDPIYRIAAGCLALYAFLLINGFFNSSFGGKATAPFMLLLSLVVVSNKLLEIASRPSANGERTQLYARVGG
jgi:exopolysaccharide production protein ExoQ